MCGPFGVGDNVLVGIYSILIFALFVCPRSSDAEYAWKKMDGISVDGRKWKLDYATKVHRKSVCPVVRLLSKLSKWRSLWVGLTLSVHQQEDFKFFGWKLPEDMYTPSPSRSRYVDISSHKFGKDFATCAGCCCVVQF